MATPPKPAQRPDNNGLIGCAVIGAIILVVYALNQCSTSTDSGNALDANMTIDANATAEAPAAAPVEPLSATSVNTGIAHLRLAFAAEGFPGTMIYSQNCYDALSHHFTWAKLDICGAVDMLAARSIDNAEAGALDNEVSYFQSETAATRYLGAATGAGEDTADADTRLSQLQGRIARARLVAPLPPPDDAGDEAANDVEPDSDINSTNWLDRALAHSTDD